MQRKESRIETSGDGTQNFHHWDILAGYLNADGIVSSFLLSRKKPKGTVVSSWTAWIEAWEWTSRGWTLPLPNALSRCDRRIFLFIKTQDFSLIHSALKPWVKLQNQAS